MFKKFFKFIALPFKSDDDIENYSAIHPKAGKVAKFIKGIFTAINVYVDLWSLNELLKIVGKGFKHFPDIVKISGKIGEKIGKAVANFGKITKVATAVV